jgi:hypothetical protein
LPAYTARPGPFFGFGDVTVTGRRPLVVTFIGERVSRLTSRKAVAFVGTVAATRAGRGAEVPLRRACGRYVDWYKLQPAA